MREPERFHCGEKEQTRGLNFLGAASLEIFWERKEGEKTEILGREDIPGA